MKLTKYFSKSDILIWSSSVAMIIVSFLLFDRQSYLTPMTSLIGVTALIFCAKGNPFGQMLMIVFCILYGIISLSFNYFGEMLTYIGMSMPMAIFSLISWLKNPFEGNRAEVKVNVIPKKEIPFIIILTSLVTFAFYFILKELGTANLIPSTFSVATSFAAAYLTFRRSPYYAVIYGLNDIVLILLWLLASLSDTRYISVVVCFAAFLINDIYSYISWQKMKKRQAGGY